MATEQTTDSWSLEIEEHQAPSAWFSAAVYDGDRPVARIPHADPAWNTDVQDRTQAEARLIAAAPDLLSALTELAAFFEANQGHRIDTDPNIGALHGMVRAAIEKARGGEANRAS